MFYYFYVGMGFALLAGVSPGVGLYMAFFHSLVYFIFGTSRHISVGTSSVVSVMSLRFVQEYGSSYKTSSGESVEAVFTPIQVVTALSMACSLQLVYNVYKIPILHVHLFDSMVQLLMAVFQLGMVSSLLSESLISGFITGTAVHVLASQIKDLFWINIDRLSGVCKVGKV